VTAVVATDTGVSLPGPRISLFRTPSLAWLLSAIALILVGWALRPGIRQMIAWALLRPEYSHISLVLLIALFLIWQQRHRLAHLPFTGSWTGLMIAAGGVFLSLLGKLATVYTLEDYALIVMVLGTTLALTGWRFFRPIAAPLLILLFMVPLPEFLYANFSAALQLLSSRIGVWLMRLFNVTVFLEGNVIDLGSFKLQVAEACDGLRYLFPLMTIGFLIAYLYKASFWRRALIFLSSIPITILINSLRVGMIGVMVEHWGVGMAQGFLHEFQGWLMFMAAGAVMLLEVYCLARLDSRNVSWRLQFGLDLPADSARGAARIDRKLPASFFVTVAVLVFAAAAMLTLPGRPESVPPRREFAEFPAQLGPWLAERSALEPVYAEWLGLDDYLLADFRDSSRTPVNLYIAWYDSQAAGRSTHSPRTCIPAGGWQIEDLSQRRLPAGARVGSDTLHVNRAVIRLGSRRTLVYYWFQQRGRIITSEYLVKWYLFWDGLFQNRTDGALVRLVVTVPSGADIAAGDRQLTDFASELVGALTPFIPD